MWSAPQLLKQYLMEPDVQGSVYWLKSYLKMDFWGKVHREYHHDARIAAHDRHGACRLQCCSLELTNVIIDLDQGPSQGVPWAIPRGPLGHP